jgi:hypothetical protein
MTFETTQPTAESVDVMNVVMALKACGVAEHDRKGCMDGA